MKLSSFATIAALSFFLLASSVHADLRAFSLHAADTAEEHEQQDRRTLTGGCTDHPVGWTDSYGWSCSKYKELNLCASDGDLYAKYGYTANMACCTCGGGDVCPVDPKLGDNCDWPAGKKCPMLPVCCNGSDEIQYVAHGGVCEGGKIAHSQSLKMGYILCGTPGYKDCF